MSVNKVVELNPDRGLIRDDDCYSCSDCGATSYMLQRDGSIVCWGCKEVMHVCWFDPAEDPGTTS